MSVSLLQNETFKDIDFSEGQGDHGNNKKIETMVKISNKVRRQIKAYIEEARKKWPISAVFLFGSHTKGKAEKDSDIDLAIISPKFKREPTFKTLERLQALKWGIAPDIEPLAFNEKEFHRAGPIDFAGGVVKREGVLIYQKNRYFI